MPRTVQIRNLDDDVYDALRRQAAEIGVSVPELLRREATRMASCMPLAVWIERTRGHRSEATRAEVLAALDEIRGPWPT